MIILYLILNYLKCAFNPSLLANWAEAIATFLAVIVAMSHKIHLTATIHRISYKDFRFYINNLYFTPATFKILTIKLNENTIDNGRLSFPQKFNKPQYLKFPPNLSNKFEKVYDKNKSPKNNLIVYIYFEDLNNRLYKLTYMANDNYKNNNKVIRYSKIVSYFKKHKLLRNHETDLSITHK